MGVLMIHDFTKKTTKKRLTNVVWWSAEIREQIEQLLLLDDLFNAIAYHGMPPSSTTLHLDWLFWRSRARMGCMDCLPRLKIFFQSDTAREEI